MDEPLTEGRKWLKRIEIKCRSCHRLVAAYIEKNSPPSNLQKLCFYCSGGEKNLNPHPDMLDTFLREMTEGMASPVTTYTPKHPDFKRILLEMVASCANHDCELNTHCQLYAARGSFKFKPYETKDGIIDCDYFVGAKDEDD